MRIDDITLQDVKEHLKIDYNDDDTYLIDRLNSAKHYIEDYTGLTGGSLINNMVLGDIVLMIVADLYDNRGATADSKESVRINKIYDSMLNMYCVNLL